MALGCTLLIALVVVTFDQVRQAFSMQPVCCHAVKQFVKQLRQQSNTMLLGHVGLTRAAGDNRGVAPGLHHFRIPELDAGACTVPIGIHL